VHLIHEGSEITNTSGRNSLLIGGGWSQGQVEELGHQGVAAPSHRNESGLGLWSGCPPDTSQEKCFRHIHLGVGLR